MDIKDTITAQAVSAKNASRKLALLSSDEKNKILLAIAEALVANKDEILFQNDIDVTAASEAEMTPALIDRLTLTEKNILAMSKSIREIIDQKDPVGEIMESTKRPNGLLVTKTRVPLGVIGIIYESRPNVTVDAIALCLKAGNAVILRGGSEARNSNHTLARIVAHAAYTAGLPQGAIQFVDTTDREAIHALLKLNHLIDVIIPRGSQQMIQTILSMSTIPVIQHGSGICHVYVDEFADTGMAEAIAFNAKVQRPGVCNAMETLLVHAKIADAFLPSMGKKFMDAGVEIRGCKRTLALLQKAKVTAIPAVDADWDTEYLGLIISIKIIDSIDEAILHISQHGTGHSESIVTNNQEHAEKFLREVDAASVMHNASTRFSDGGEFGLGAEIGISTQKLHARGPMGVRELTSYKYIVYGNGQVRG